jgi:hypothetical protein
MDVNQRVEWMKENSKETYEEAVQCKQTIMVPNLSQRHYFLFFSYPPLEELSTYRQALDY